ncbi:MAG: MATE family efflux transporter [Erysipelotrichaceae bacterium]|nr:MATE family efflux transporter [Erysipelotrichaceae bacterium]
MKKRRLDILEGDLLPNILLFTVPVILSSVLQLLFNAIDMIVVGKFSGSVSMAAVSSTSSLINLIINLFIGLSVGCSVAIARRIGKRDYDEISKAVHTTIFLAFIAGVILTFVGIIFSHKFLEMMNSPADVIDLSTIYLRFYFTGVLATMIYNFSSAVLRAKGDTKRPLIALTIAGVLNALLNLFFVTVLKMDVAGVGLASSLSSYVSAVLVLLVLIRDDEATHVDIRHLYIDPAALKEILLVGLPAGIQSTVFSISNVAIQSSVNEFGQIVMAGNGAASSIGDFVYNIMNAFYQSCLTFTSQNVGAGKRKRIMKILLTCIFLVTIFGLLFGNSAYYFGNFLLGIYSDDPSVIEAGLTRLRIICCPYFICGIMDVFVGSLRGMGSSIVPMIVSLMGACAFRLIYITTYFKVHHTIEVLYYSYPLSWIITAFVHLLTFIIVYRRYIKKNDESN